MTDDILEITPLALPYDPDAKIFWVHCCDEDKEDRNDCIKAGCYKISYRDSLELFEDVAGINEDLLGAADALDVHAREAVKAQHNGGL